MNYAREVRDARQEREAVIERARAEARRAIAAAAAARDAEIRALRAREPKLGLEEIARTVGCSGSTVYDVLNPERRVQHNRRRREYARLPESRARYNQRRRERGRAETATALTPAGTRQRFAGDL